MGQHAALALLAVAAAALCSGAAAVLQASAVSRLPPASSVRTGLVLRLARSPRYLLALALIAAGFALAIFALRTLPLFAVQAGRASSLGVTAVLSVLVLGVRLRRPETVAVVCIGAGLMVVGLTAGVQSTAEVGAGVRLALLAAVAITIPVAAAAARMANQPAAGLLLAVLAGACFAMLALGARIVIGFAPLTLLADPAAWAMAGAGALGLLYGALALQRASVVTVTSAMVATETVLGALLGMVVCGDAPAPGLGVFAGIGFVLVLFGALALARFGAPEPDLAGREEPASLPIG